MKIVTLLTFKVDRKIFISDGENLRDNITNMELILNMLAEPITIEILKEVSSQILKKLKKDLNSKKM